MTSGLAQNCLCPGAVVLPASDDVVASNLGVAVPPADMNLSCEAMADWIFEGNPRHYDLDAAVAASREHWWGTPRFRDEMAIGNRVWLQVVGPKDPGIYYVATIVTKTYEQHVDPSEPAHFRWRTDIRFDYRIRPALLRS